jgi:HAD superfamily hydrolase (TIGR01509 family)
VRNTDPLDSPRLHERDGTSGQAGVLVDVDGTLVDSNYHHTLAWGAALGEHGYRVEHAVVHRLIGMGGDEMLHELIGHDDDAVTRSWRKRFDALVPEIAAFEGAATLLRSFKARGFTVVLATSSPAELLDAMREKIAADDAIDAVVTSADVGNAKPAPDIFELALQFGEIDRDRALALGDSRWDVVSAGRAGVRCVALESGGTSEAELLECGALAVYRDPMALHEQLVSSPFSELA